MKNQNEGAGCRHAWYDAKYKREALKVWRGSGRSAAKVAPFASSGK
jgi:hypothetical protein